MFHRTKQGMIGNISFTLAQIADTIVRLVTFCNVATTWPLDVARYNSIRQHEKLQKAKK